MTGTLMERLRKQIAALKADAIFVMDHKPLKAAGACAAVGAVIGLVIGAAVG
jgi:ElaB/YqjD/DUF883 family membrane-anchored ribosome-binding protein